MTHAPAKFLTMALVLIWMGVCAIAQDAVKPGSIYDADPKHLWNRVHAALLCRIGPDGKTYGEDRLEPLLWKHSEHLLLGKSFDDAITVLNEFVDQDGAALIQAPLKRAVLQRDLWLIANWLTGKPDSNAKQRLQTQLTRIIGRLALSTDQIENLPDNYAMAVAAKFSSHRFDEAHPERSYLPEKLFDPEGPWIPVGRIDGPIAPQHLRENSTGPFTNSVFLLLLKLPDGRQATLDFLKQLDAFSAPHLLPNPDEKTRRSFPVLPNPALPQWPKGTEVALVRRAMLINSDGAIVASPITESLQLRVMRTGPPTPAAATVELAKSRANWSFFEFQFRRRDLWGNSLKGLRDVSADRDFKTGFMSHPSDEFDNPMQPTKPFPVRSQPFENNRASCIGCHQLPGVYSFNSLNGFQFGRLQIARDEAGHESSPFRFKATPIRQVEAAAVQWKETQASWKQLGTMMNK